MAEIQHILIQGLQCLGVEASVGVESVGVDVTCLGRSAG